MFRFARLLVTAGLICIVPATLYAQSAPAQVKAAPATMPAPAPAPAPAKPAPAPQKKEPVDGLKPGQFIWEARANEAKNLRIIAVLDIQRLYVFDGDELVALTTISSGKKGKATPTGNFTILQKNIDHRSNIYSNAPMPYMQRLTWDGIALHAGHNPGYPASHGCIRLPLAFAKALYGVTKMDQSVIVLPDLKPRKPVEPQPAPQPTPQPTQTPSVEAAPAPAPEATPAQPPAQPTPKS
jgi:lipoprotein-anchoring transpeptidase ErfK/SrfK